MSNGRIRVLVVEDSIVTRQLLLHILNCDPSLEVIGVATDGEEAIAIAQQQRPDIITMDVNMPRLNGLDATRAIMESVPTPIIVVSNSIVASEVSSSFEALSAGALMALPKPTGIDHPDHEATARGLVQTIKLMSEVKVVRRLTKCRLAQTAPTIVEAAQISKNRMRCVVIGASTGGPVVLQKILSALPADFPAPVLVVQHMAPGFIEGMAQWLNQSCPLPVCVAANSETARVGHVYLAADGLQLRIDRNGCLSLTDEDKWGSYRPSITCLFSSAGEVYGRNVVGILLTGMGDDGAAGLRELKDRGALTIAQDEASSVVFGMPREAIKLGGAQQVLPPEKIASLLQEMASQRV